MVQQETSTPSVWRWYVVYCVLMALLYLFTFGAGIFMLFINFFIDPSELGEEIMVFRVQGALFAGLGLVLLSVYAAAPFLPKQPWVWIYGIVMIGIGMTSLCCLPATIPLLIFWIKPEVQRFFGRNPKTE